MDSYTFLNRVDFVFKDLQAKEWAQCKLESLRQGLKPFLEAFTEQQSLLIESGGGSWPDDAKKISLDRILSDELVQAMITVPSQPDFESYYLILKETNDRLRAYKACTTKPKGTATPQPFQKQSIDIKRPFIDSKNFSGPKVTYKAFVESIDQEPTPIKAVLTSTKRVKQVSYKEQV